MRSALPRRFLLCHSFLLASPPSALSFPSARSVRSRSPAQHAGYSPVLARDPRRRRRPRLSFLPRAAPMSAAPASQSDVAASAVLGGDYAGLSATFCPKTGELVPVPEHLVPEAMVEWGDIPSSLETLASEDWVAAGELERTTIAVLPEVGCGIDNLEITSTSERFGRAETWRLPQPEREAAAVDRLAGRRLEMETVFQVDSAADEEGERVPRRIRVSLSADAPGEGEDPALSKLIALRVERRISPGSTRGEAWSGPKHNSGGLDARTVTSAIGKDIAYGDVFAVKRTKGGGDPWDLGPGAGGDGEPPEALEGRWTRTGISPESDSEEVQRTKGYFGCGEGAPLATLRLPQNVLVRYGRGVSEDAEAWAVEVSHIGTVTVDGKTCLQRRVVTRSLGGIAATEEDARDRGSLGGISYGVEERPASQ